MEQSQVTGVRDEIRSTVLDAAARLLAEHGARGVTTRAVAQAAGVQPPTIYRLFGDKDGLVDALAEHVMATYVAGKSVSVARSSGDPVADLRAGWQLHVEFGLANPELYALLNTPGRGEPSPATAAGIEVLRTLVRRLAADGLLRVDERRAVAMIHAAGTGTVLALLGMPAELRDPGLAEAMFGAVADRILTAAPPAPDATMTTVAVTFATVVPELPALSDAERALMAEWLTRSLRVSAG
ncbi:TetR/AcrR family transcriptional regulator [Dactylosporangium sp. NPDC049742]|uniref:TetR/AcrR family transcriptional regulator n=1 Tax=Dactylosporangium sp. NPDC049742 TaxID=3154737 RepID=UPI003418CF7D